MKFIFGYPFFTAPPNENFLAPGAIGELAKAIEDSGCIAAFFSEHPVPTNSWRESGGHDALDPFVALSFVAEATENLKLLTNLTIPPYRNPLLLAKTSATLDVLSGGRLILGIGTGYLKGEYFALGVDFEERNELFDESVEAMKLIWRGEPIDFEGKHFSAKDVIALPRPAQVPHPPLWLGGNSKLTRRRIAEWGQGWIPMPNPRALADRRRSAPLETNEDLAEMISYMRNHAEELGRTDPIDITHMSFAGGMAGAKDFNLQEHLDDIGELSELGVTHLAMNALGSDLNEVKDQLDFLAREVIAPFK